MTQGAQLQPPVPAAWELPTPGLAGEEEGPSRLVEYVLLRVTGIALAVLVLGHFALTHLVTDVAATDSSFVARRLSSALWVAWDAAMLGAALAHGAVGVRMGLADYARDPRTLRRLERGVAALAAAIFVVGAVALGRAAGG